MSSLTVLSYSGSDPALTPYRSMIYSDFMRSLRYGNDWYALIDPDCYYSVYKQIINQLLSRTESQVRLAVLTDDHDVCLGWSLSEGPRFHYVFVKKDYRKQGIGEALSPKDFRQVTHLTKIGQAIRKSKFPKVIFNPF